MSYTPGPWGVFGPYSSVTIWQDTGSEYESQIAELWNWKNGEASEEVRANARLIAAAPELLEALDSLAYTAGWALAWIRNNDEIYNFLGQDITKAKAAIAKAKGEEG